MSWLKTTRRILLIGFFGLILSIAGLGLAQPAFAADSILDKTCAPTITDNNGVTIPNPAATSSICQSRGNGQNPIAGSGSILSKVTSLLDYAAGIAAVVVLLIAGIMYITSNGDSNRVSTVRQMIIYTFIGLAVVILARSIVVFIINRA